MSNTAPTMPLDFAALLSKNYRPARASRLIANEAYSEYEPKDNRNKNGEAAKRKENEELDAARDAEVSKLMMQLVSETPFYNNRHGAKAEHSLVDDSDDHRPPEPPLNEWETLPSALHAVELDDWEKRIEWEGLKEDENKEPEVVSSSAEQVTSSDAASLLARRRNPYLDALVFDDTNISWEGSREDAMEKARRVNLILEKGTAGQSIARSVLPVERPMPFGQSEAYLRRYEREWSTPATSSAELSKGTLHADREKMEAYVEARQKKREQMAIDKSVRVTEAMGTLSTHTEGKGRTITSSLMGPGGTERTGRPSRPAGSSSHDLEYVEQLDFVYNHSLVASELSKALLRQYHRPKLPMSIVRTDLPWQFQIRYAPSAQKADSNMNSSSYQSVMMGAGALSQTKIKRESDLSPAEGNLVLLEYSEERPPIQLTKGHASKIINYYRGDKSRCPISAGGGDRPTRKKRREISNTASSTDATQAGKDERSTRLVGPNEASETTVMDWIGKPPKKTRDERTEKPSIDVLPEGVTEMLHKQVHGPFIGDVEDGVTQIGLISNLLVAPMFRHDPESTDFLMILGTKPDEEAGLNGPPQTLGVVLRPLPTSVFTVGQTEPRTRVVAPGGNKEKEFLSPFYEYHIAKLLNFVENTEGRGMRSDEILDELFPDAKITAGKNNSFRPRMKNVADCEGSTYTLKSPAEFVGVEALGRRFSPQSVAAYEAACAASRRLRDLGITHFDSKGTSSVAAVGIATVYLTGQVNALRELSRKMRKMVDFAKGNKSNKKSQIVLYEKAADELESAWKEARRRLEVARFIYEELQLTPWNLTGEFIDVHKKGAGTGMMRLTGVGDPSGRGEGFNFIREEAKSNKTTGNTDGALNAQIKKITGTDNDLRKLTMKQMASLLRSYGMGQKEIDTLKRWDRVHVIRDLSTKGASDGMGDGLERFARGEKMKLTEQKQQYRDRVQEIWRRQRAALSSDPGDARGSDNAPSETGTSLDAEQKEATAENKEVTKDEEDSDSDSDDDDEIAAMLESDMMHVQATNQLVAAHVRGEAGDDGEKVRGQPRLSDSSELATDAHALAQLRREHQEDLMAKEGMSSGKRVPTGHEQSMVGRKVIRKRVTKTFPDGRQTTTFKFVVVPAEVDKIIARKSGEAGSKDETARKKKVHKHDTRKRQIGHSMFEDEDQGRIGTRFQVSRTTRTIKGGRAPKHKPRLGKFKSSVSQQSRNRKRQREADEADLYVAPSKRKGTSNRRERGSARDRMPHVVFAKKLEAIRSLVERRPGSIPFHKPVNRRAVPRYYEVISNPIDLATIREKIHK